MLAVVEGPEDAALWSLIAVYLALVVGYAWDPTPLAQGLAAAGIAIGNTSSAPATFVVATSP